MHNQSPLFLQIAVAINGKLLNTYTFADREIVIGRSPDCHVQLDNPGASRQHAKIVNDGNKLYVHDLQSGNGTFLNGKRVTQAVLTPNDSLNISKFTLTVKFTTEPPEKHHLHNNPDDGNTIFLRPDERAKIVEQQAQSNAHAKPSPVITKATPQKSTSTAAVFAAGLAAGLLLGWLIWG